MNQGYELTSRVGAGAFFTLFLAKPSTALSDVRRHPEHVDSSSVCIECNEDRGEDDPPMECEKVSKMSRDLSDISVTSHITLNVLLHLYQNGQRTSGFALNANKN